MQLGFKEVEELFAGRYGLKLPSIAFRGRLQHLQRNEFPDATVNPGKGKKAVYGWDQIFQLSVALDLIDVGLSPDAATALVRINVGTILRGAAGPGVRLETVKLLKAVEEEKCPWAVSSFLTVAAHALFAMGTREPSLTPRVGLYSGQDLITELKGDNPFKVSETYIDMGKRVMLTLNHISFIIRRGSLSETVAGYQEWASKHVLDL